MEEAEGQVVDRVHVVAQGVDLVHVAQPGVVDLGEGGGVGLVVAHTVGERGVEEVLERALARGPLDTLRSQTSGPAFHPSEPSTS